MRPATDILRDIAAGELVENLGDAIRTVNAAVDVAGKAGSITLVINLKPAGRGTGATEVTYDVRTKEPRLARAASIMWGTPEGDLLAQDPRQQRLDLRTVDAPPNAVREVADTPATALRTA